MKRSSVIFSVFILTLITAIASSVTTSVLNDKSVRATLQAESDPSCILTVQEQFDYSPRHCTESDWKTAEIETVYGDGYNILIQEFTGDPKGGYRIKLDIYDKNKKDWFVDYELLKHRPDKLIPLPDAIADLFMVDKQIFYIPKQQAPYGLTISGATICPPNHQ